MAHTSDMLNPRELSERLSAVSAPMIARLSGVSLKTIYRIRQDPDYGCTHRNAERLSRALAQLGREARKTGA